MAATAKAGQEELDGGFELRDPALKENVKWQGQHTTTSSKGCKSQMSMHIMEDQAELMAQLLQTNVDADAVGYEETK
ncbi:hypothetical protein BSKO_03510 [Bryopsis sp. KO-2023]|nr:hypothetical protein BSKO_03510 [Bryopsis sp. KO-2023]